MSSSRNGKEESALQYWSGLVLATGTLTEAAAGALQLKDAAASGWSNNLTHPSCTGMRQQILSRAHQMPPQPTTSSFVSCMCLQPFALSCPRPKIGVQARSSCCCPGETCQDDPHWQG